MKLKSTRCNRWWLFLRSFFCCNFINCYRCYVFLTMRKHRSECINVLCFRIGFKIEANLVEILHSSWQPWLIELPLVWNEDTRSTVSCFQTRFKSSRTLPEQNTLNIEQIGIRNKHTICVNKRKTRGNTFYFSIEHVAISVSQHRFCVCIFL